MLHVTVPVGTGSVTASQVSSQQPVVRQVQSLSELQYPLLPPDPAPPPTPDPPAPTPPPPPAPLPPVPPGQMGLQAQFMVLQLH
jgi:hypothetical protein